MSTWRKCNSFCRYKKKHPDGPAAKSPAKATKAKKDVKPTKKAAKEAPKMLSEDEDDMEEGEQVSSPFVHTLSVFVIFYAFRF